jgi:hypothetical protein
MALAEPAGRQKARKNLESLVPIAPNLLAFFIDKTDENLVSLISDNTSVTPKDSEVA